MTRKEHMIRSWQREAVKQRLVRGDRFRDFQTLAVPAAKNVRRNHQLVTTHIRLASYLIGIKIVV